MMRSPVDGAPTPKSNPEKSDAVTDSAIQEQLRRYRLSEKTLGSISKILLSDLETRTALTRTLAELLSTSEHSRAYLLQFRPAVGDEREDMKLHTEVTADGVSRRFDEHHSGVVAGEWISPEGYQRLSRNRIHKASATAALLLEPLLDDGNQVCSYIVIPVQVEGRWWGNLFFEDIVRAHTYEEVNVSLLRTGADMVGAYLACKSAVDALVESEKKLRMVAENTLDGIWLMNMDLRFTYVNPSVEYMLGYTPEEWIGSSLREHCSQEDLERMSGIILQALEVGDHPGVLFETKLRHKDGEFIPVEILGKFLYDSENRVIGLQGTTRDIRERKEAENQRHALEARLRQLHKMEALGTLAGGVAHDFNNILSAIIGYAELAKLGVSGGSQMASHLDAVMNAGMRATDLVKQILTFSRQSEQKRRPINVAPLIKEALKLLRSSLPTTIEIRRSIGNNLGSVLADPTQIHQIVMNLCTNAAHAMDENGGILTVNLDQVDLDQKEAGRFQDLHPGPFIRLSIKDTGQGIDRDIIDSIFDPYFTTKAVGEGTGMGLSVVLGIVKSYGGEISVHSKPGKGSLFEVYLPAIHGETKTITPRESDLPMGDEKILFVDDEPELVLIGKRRLERLGYRVEAMSSSQEALDTFRSNPDGFNLVVTDMTMPGMTGAKLAQEILRLRKDMPIILCTGYSRQISEEKALKMGIRAFLMKPLVFTDLAESVRRILDTEKPTP